MSKPHWAYNPLADAGVSLANQEDAARETAEAIKKDSAYGRDYAAIVEALRVELRRVSEHSRYGRGPAYVIRRVGYLCAYPDNALSHEQPWVFFAERWGVPALLRALARAIELETK